MISLRRLTKNYGSFTAVDAIDLEVPKGELFGFLGPNGAGKTTTLRILLGLVRATEGGATIGGKHYAELDRPLQNVGAVLEASSFHPVRTAPPHLAPASSASSTASW
jgi:ABC-2 type transport system ATP-binding protein